MLWSVYTATPELLGKEGDLSPFCFNLKGTFWWEVFTLCSRQMEPRGGMRAAGKPNPAELSHHTAACEGGVAPGYSAQLLLVGHLEVLLDF